MFWAQVSILLLTSSVNLASSLVRLDLSICKIVIIIASIS